MKLRYPNVKNQIFNVKSRMPNLKFQMSNLTSTLILAGAHSVGLAHLVATSALAPVLFEANMSFFLFVFTILLALLVWALSVIFEHFYILLAQKDTLIKQQAEAISLKDARIAHLEGGSGPDFLADERYQTCLGLLVLICHANLYDAQATQRYHTTGITGSANTVRMEAGSFEKSMRDKGKAKQEECVSSPSTSNSNAGTSQISSGDLLNTYCERIESLEFQPETPTTTTTHGEADNTPIQHTTAMFNYDSSPVRSQAEASAPSTPVPISSDSPNDENDKCAVCLDVLYDDSTLYTLACGHSFHTSCIGDWSKRGHSSCHMCRADVLQTCKLGSLGIACILGRRARGDNFMYMVQYKENTNMPTSSTGAPTLWLYESELDPEYSHFIHEYDELIPRPEMRRSPINRAPINYRC